MRRFASILPILLFSATGLYADITLFDRGLPTANLNNAAGADRSNVAWGDSYDSKAWAIGDDFNLGLPGSYDITDLRVWIIGTDAQPLSAMWDDLTLFGGGTTAGSINVLSTGSTSGSHPNIIFTPVTYANGEGYQGSSGHFIDIWQVDFLLNWAVDGSTTYTFFVGGTPTALNKTLYPNYPGLSPFLHASNKDLSGSSQQGADDFAREIGYTGTTVTDTDSWHSKNNGWDKNSDINVQIIGTPEPSAIVLLGTLAAGLGLLIRRKRRP